MFSEAFFWYLVLFPVLVPTILYVIIFKELPTLNMKRDWQILKECAEIVANHDDRVREGDLYFEDDDEPVDSNQRASVRHPNNVDRAYAGSVERFDDGGR